jgi:hypothetical protein
MNLLSNYTEMLRFVEKELDEMLITSDKPNIKAAATLLTVTIDHAQGIRILLEKGAYPSAAALMRVVFETYIRAMWISECANEKQVEIFINKDKVVSTEGKSIYFKDLVKAVEASYGLPAYLSEIQTHVWSGLNSLTHSGNIQLARNFDGKTIRHCYDDELVNEVIDFSTMLTCLAFSGILDLANNKNVESVSRELLKTIEPWAFNKSSKKDAASCASS